MKNIYEKYEKVFFLLFGLCERIIEILFGDEEKKINNKSQLDFLQRKSLF